jgi:hypothetical protein
VDGISWLLFHDSESEWSDSVDADNDRVGGCKDSNISDSVGNDK